MTLLACKKKGAPIRWLGTRFCAEVIYDISLKRFPLLLPIYQLVRGGYGSNPGEILDKNVVNCPMKQGVSQAKVTLCKIKVCAPAEKLQGRSSTSQALCWLYWFNISLPYMYKSKETIPHHHKNNGTSPLFLPERRILGLTNDDNYYLTFLLVCFKHIWQILDKSIMTRLIWIFL